MPTYEYICKNCSYEFEEFQKMSDPALRVCPKCSGVLERKIGGGAGLLFKGNGFYITDYKKNNPQVNKSVDTPKETKKPEKNTQPKKEDNS